MRRAESTARLQGFALPQSLPRGSPQPRRPLPEMLRTPDFFEETLRSLAMNCPGKALKMYQSMGLKSKAVKLGGCVSYRSLLWSEFT